MCDLSMSYALQKNEGLTLQVHSVGREYHTLMRIERAVTSDFTNEELRVRSGTCSGKESEGLLLFRVSTDDQECGLVLFDTEEDDDSLWIEELWIPSDLRGRGLGSAILAQVDEVATSLGRSKLAVWAEPLDDGNDDQDAKARLVDWYIRNGFTCSGGPWDELERPVSLHTV